MFTSPRLIPVAGLILAWASVTMAADLQLNRYYTDHMVLQRGKAVVVRGSADAGASVTVGFNGQSRTATADGQGAWSVTLDAMDANARGQDLTVASPGAKAITLSDVLVGDVILYGRQTTVDVSLGSTEEGRNAITHLNASPILRAIRIETIASKKPLDDLDAKATDGWAHIDEAAAARMSAAAFYLGRDVVKQVGVPVGVVDLNMGCYFAIGWLSDEAIRATIKVTDDKDLQWLIDNMRKDADARDDGSAQRELDEYYADLIKKANGKPVGPKPSLGIHPLENPMFPCGGYNAVIHPLCEMTFHAVVLQLGADYPYIPYRRLAKLGLAQTEPELDAAWAQNYLIMKLGYRTSSKTTPVVIGDWRNTFNDASIPFGLVNPPSSALDALAQHNREMRELQRRISIDNTGVGLILPGVENTPFSGQPSDENLLADRCRHWLLADVYGKKDTVATGPQFDRLDAFLADATIHFKAGTAEGLTATDDVLKCFEAAAPGGEFFPATARVEGNTVKLHCPEAGQIQYVRFNWQNNPSMGLTNSAGLPALPFNTDDRWTFAWYSEGVEEVLPPEYSTTADQWGDNDIAIINGEVDYLESGDSEPIPRRPGPIGIYSSPFGPNIYVISIDPGTPAVGKLFPGDYIFGVNGEKFTGPGDAPYIQLSHAITHSESDEGAGKLELMVRRGKKVIGVTLQLRVLGTYSPTTPYYCQKTENLIKRAEQWVIDRCRPQTGPAGIPSGMLGTDVWFLLATGDPEVQGLVRRAVYDLMKSMDPLEPADPNKGAHNWMIGYNAILLGEYYNATGDRNVLPYMKNLADWAAVTQIKAPGPEPVPWEVAQADEHVGGYRQRYNPTGADRWKSGYGLMPPAGIACVQAMIYADQAGLDVDQDALKNGIRHFRYQRAEHGFVEYLYWNLRRDSPAALDPDAETNGMLWSQNGKLGEAAALFSLIDDHQPVEICSRYCVYSYNRTRTGHGGMFFNNFWTPIGAFESGKKGFQHFMQGQQWWRELYRNDDGSFTQAGRGGVGVGYAIHYAAPRQRLRIFGAPHTAFGKRGEQTPYLQPALKALHERDYALCEKLLVELPGKVVISSDDQPMVDHFLQSVRILRASINNDLAYAEKQIELGNYDYAVMDLPQLQGVVAADNPRLKTIVESLGSPEVQRVMKNFAGQRAQEEAAKEAALQGALPPKKNETWACLTPDLNEKKAGDAEVWKMKLIEDISQAPADWADVGFADSSWDDARQPISWAMYHTVLFRGTFNIEDKSKFDKLRFRGGFFQQGSVLVYINGQLVAKVNNIGRG
ncbi:MAG: hypothetical protein GC164_05560 [Phycisphaera sp.]|nr:hypothetical protein [Phycisphaera sp.]